MKDGYFSIKRDTELMNGGGFFCEACLIGKPMDDISLDPRYCQNCYELLLKEADLLPRAKRPRWISRAANAKKASEKAILVAHRAWY